MRKELREGETIRVSSGCLVAFTQDVEYDVQTIPGFKNVLFGGEGLFVTTLTGPGTIWLQGMPPNRMISEIARRVPSGGIGLPLPIGMMGGGGGGGAEGADDGENGGGDTGGGGDDGATADEPFDADRSDTVTSSGIHPGGDGGGGDGADSPSELFGDAAAPSAYGSDGGGDGGVGDSSSSSSVPGMEEETSFSTEDAAVFPDDDDTTSFGDDGVGSTGDMFGEGESTESFDTGGGMDSGGGDDEGGGLFGKLWDFFTDD